MKLTIPVPSGISSLNKSEAKPKGLHDDTKNDSNYKMTKKDVKSAEEAYEAAEAAEDTYIAAKDKRKLAEAVKDAAYATYCTADHAYWAAHADHDEIKYAAARTTWNEFIVRKKEFDAAGVECHDALAEASSAWKKAYKERYL